MPRYIPVDVITQKDDGGNVLPAGILWGGTVYKIVRVIHISQPDDMVISYTILIGNRHRRLMYNGIEWRISSLPANNGGKGDNDGKN